MSNFFSPSASATSSSTSSSSRSVPSDGAAKPLTAASASPHNILLRCPSPPVHPQSHTAFLIPLCRCCHIHQYPNLCSPQHHLYLLPRPSTSTSTSISAGHGGPISESSSNRSFSTDPYSYTTDCSPRSVIRHVYSSSSGPSPGPGFSNLHSTYCMGASGEVAKKKCHTVVGTSSSMIDNQHSTLNDESRSVVLGLQDRHVLMQGHPSILAQWNSSAEVQNEEFTHTRQGDLYSEGRLSITHVQNSSRIYHNAESEKVSVQDSRLTKIPMQEQKCILTSGSAQTEKNGGIDSLSASMGLNRSDVTGVRHGAGECYSEVQCSGIQDRKESDAERDSATNTHLRWPGVLVATSDAPSNKIQGQNHGADQRQRMSHPCSLNSDLQDDEGNSPGLWMRGNAVVAISTANGTSKCSDAVTSKSTDTVLGYVDGMRTFHHHHHHHHHHHLRARQRNTLGSKWEDAERWLRPAAQQHHQSMACRRLIPRFGLLRMSDCLSTGTSALQPHSFQPMPVDLNCVADHSPLHSSCACWKYESLCSCKHAVLSSTHTHDGCGSSAPSKEPETVIGHATSTVSKPSISVDCFDVDLINHKLNMSSPKDHVADQNMRGQIPNDPHAQKYCIEKIDQSNDYITSTEPIGECGEPSIPRPLPRSTNYGIVTPFTDKFVNAKTLSCLSTHLAHVTSNDQDICTRLSIQDRVAMPMVSLRDVGTQISSVDGSGSISRYTSQNGSPSRHSGVLVMPKTATVSLWGCGKISRQVMEDSSTSGKQWEQPLVKSIDLRDLAEQHRLRLELQARLSAEQHSRFSSSSSLSSYSSHRGISHHRTTSNWSSREVEEADLSRSLRHSTAEFEDESTSGPVHGASRNRCNEPLPCSASSSWSTWDEGPVRVARLQEEEERIQAWETKIKSKADAKLKKLEENLAKKRSQTTMKIKERLAVAQRKVEEMRANVYSHQGRSTKKGRNHPRSFSLSPLSRCTCFSAS